MPAVQFFSLFLNCIPLNCKNQAKNYSILLFLDCMDFRERLRDEIAFSGLSNKEVAARAGITIRSLVSYVSSQACIPSAEVAVRLARVLNTSVEYLVSGEKSRGSQDSTNEDERKLLYVYKNLPESQRKLLLAVADDISKYLGH